MGDTGVERESQTLDYMEKLGSGLTRICNETKALEGYKEELKPAFKSTPAQFQTILYVAADTQNVGDHDRNDIPNCGKESG